MPNDPDDWSAPPATVQQALDVLASTGGGGGGDVHPVVDTTELVEGSGDATKRMRIEVDGLTTATTRVLTMADQNVDLTPDTGSFAAAQHDIDGADHTGLLGLGKGGTNNSALSGNNAALKLDATSSQIVASGVTIDASDKLTAPCLTAQGELSSGKRINYFGDGSYTEEIELQFLASPNSGLFRWHPANNRFEFADRVMFEDRIGIGSTISSYFDRPASGQIRAYVTDRLITTGDLEVDGSLLDSAGKLVLRNEQIGMDEVVWHVPDPAVNDEFAAKIVWDKVTLVKVWAETDTGTVDLNVEKRAFGSGEAAGTDLMAADLQATDAGATQTSFTGAVDGTVTAQWLVLTISAVSAANDLKVGLQFKRYG